MSELIQLNGNDKLIVCFGGMAQKMGGIPPFEFVKYLSSIYKNEYDLIFYVDIKQCCYHNGFLNITNNIDETVIYLNEKITNGNYNKVIFMGVSAGGYAAILFGSLCNVTNIIAFIPPTKLKKPINPQFKDLKSVINKHSNYLLYADLSIKDINDCHHISHCQNIDCFSNVTIIPKSRINMKQLRDLGEIKQIIDCV